MPPKHLIYSSNIPCNGKQKLSRYRLVILASTSSDLEEFELGITSVETALPLDEEKFPINPIEFLDFRGKITVNN